MSFKRLTMSFKRVTISFKRVTISFKRLTTSFKRHTMPFKALLPRLNDLLPRLNALLSRLNALLPRLNALLSRLNALLSRLNALLPHLNDLVSRLNEIAFYFFASQCRKGGSVIFCKLFDIIILEKFQSELICNKNQFSFTQGSSTTSWSFILQEIITYHNEHNTGLFCVTLDASKAFDKVRFDKLFLKLIDRNLCPVVLILLLYMYTHQSLNVKWNNSPSQNFKYQMV